mgnify:CR=1 FL=1
MRSEAALQHEEAISPTAALYFLDNLGATVVRGKSMRTNAHETQNGRRALARPRGRERPQHPLDSTLEMKPCSPAIRRGRQRPQLAAVRAVRVRTGHRPGFLAAERRAVT